jgi:hypothetical protein
MRRAEQIGRPSTLGRRTRDGKPVPPRRAPCAGRPERRRRERSLLSAVVAISSPRPAGRPPATSRFEPLAQDRSGRRGFRQRSGPASSYRGFVGRVLAARAPVGSTRPAHERSEGRRESEAARMRGSLTIRDISRILAKAIPSTAPHISCPSHASEDGPCRALVS